MSISRQALITATCLAVGGLFYTLTLRLYPGLPTVTTLVAGVSAFGLALPWALRHFSDD